MQSKCSKNELHIFSISKAWNELHKQWKKREISPKPLAPMDARENQRSSQMWWRIEQELSSPEPRTARTSEQNGSRGGRGKGIRGARSFVPGPTASRASGGIKGPPFVPVGVSLPPLSPSLSPRPSHSAHLFLLFLARERGVLAHLFTTFVKRSLILPSIHRR